MRARGPAGTHTDTRVPAHMRAREPVGIHPTEQVTHTNTYTFLRTKHTHTHLNCIHHHIYLPQEIHGGSSKHLYMCNERVYGFPSLMRGYTDRFDGDVCAQHATIALHSSQTISASLSAA